MKYLELLATAILAATPVAAAIPQCVAGTLQNYIDLGSGGCLIGSTFFHNFVYKAGGRNGAQQIPPSAITVTPILVIPATASLDFQAPWQAASGQIQESSIGYQVLLIPPPTPISPIDQLTLQAGNMQAGTIGSVAVRETTNVANLSVFLNCIEVCQSRLEDTQQFAFVATINVTNIVILKSKAGTASLSGFTASVDLCPACV